MIKKVPLYGLNHESAPVEVREIFSIKDDEQELFLTQLLELESVEEAFVLSTCNRFEIYVHATDKEVAYKEITQFMADYFNIRWEDYNSFFYYYEDIDTIEHLIRVISSLDSLIVGEPHIFSQAKRAFLNAKRSGAIGPLWNQLFERALKVAKKIKSETKISDKPISVSTVAVELAKRVFGELTGMNALIIGAGEMSELAAIHLQERNAYSLFFTNRTEAKAIELSQKLNGSVIPFGAFKKQLYDIDVIIVSIFSDQYILSYNDIENIISQRKNKPMLIIDISIPRSVDPNINSISQVYLYNIDDLKELAEHNKRMREKEAELAKLIIKRELHSIEKWLESLKIYPVIKALHEKIEAVRLEEINTMRKKLNDLTPEEVLKIDLMTKSLIKKIINPLIEEIKILNQEKRGDEKIHWLRKIFKI